MFSRKSLASYALIAALGVAALMSLPPGGRNADAQVPSVANPAYNTDLTTAVITNTLAGVGTVNQEPATQNINWRGVVCTWATTASSGSTSTTLSIQGYDAANATWQTLKTSSAIAASSTAEAAGTPHSVAVVLGTQTSSLPTNYDAINVALPRRWRIQQVIAAGAGTNPAPAVTSKVGCNYIQ